MKKVIIIAICILSLMFAEYRFIMAHIKPYIVERGTVYLEIFGHIDEYYAESWDLGN